MRGAAHGRPSLALVAAVVLAHALMLRPAPSKRPGHAARAAAPALALRMVEGPMAQADPRPAAAPVPSAVAPASHDTAPAAPPRPAAAPRPSSWRGAPAKPRRVAVSVAPSRPEPEAPPAPSAHAPPGPPASVQPPGPATLGYRVSGTARGIPFEAEAQLLWRPATGRYAAEWTVRLPLVGARSQRSEGALTPAGLAPERYAEQSRGERAAHFDAAGGRIRFSANTPDAVLEPGAQDRLSVSLQLAGLLAAAPERYPPGSAITLQTAGVREAGAWRWEVEDDEILQIDGQAVPCAKLLRQPRGEYDTRIELWLARPFHYLPARLRVTQAGGDVADQWLRALPAGR
ncbi:DUF3108 domain-containing protein [Ottowia testudinis]|uniref:DUF3108 domain-containing protein n=1 Tax=Ottowia testudinis TaxID=2816950 RepID=A0A975CG35_9BURK|nr:DUF3108 domain-containing protein [Ottowia testudinis]QTD45141.1 DUF3108 domain-containing protein [Ottowia testudinis]